MRWVLLSFVLCAAQRTDPITLPGQVMDLQFNGPAPLQRFAALVRTPDANQFITVYELATRREIRRSVPAPGFTAFTWQPQGGSIVVASVRPNRPHEGFYTHWNLNTDLVYQLPRPLDGPTLPHGDRPCAFRSFGQLWCLTGSTFLVWDSYTHPTNRPRRVAADPSCERTTCMFDMTRRQTIQTGRLLLNTAAREESPMMMDLPSEARWQLPEATGGLDGVFSQDGRMIAQPVYWQPTSFMAIRFWDVERREHIRTLSTAPSFPGNGGRKRYSFNRDGTAFVFLMIEQICILELGNPPRTYCVQPDPSFRERISVMDMIQGNEFDPLAGWFGLGMGENITFWAIPRNGEVAVKTNSSSL